MKTLVFLFFFFCLLPWVRVLIRRVCARTSDISLCSAEDRTDRELQWEPLTEEETKQLDQVSGRSSLSTPPATSSTPTPAPDQADQADHAVDAQDPLARSALSRLMDYWTWPRPAAAEEPDEAPMF